MPRAARLRLLDDGADGRRHSGRDLVSIYGLMESVLEYNDLSHAGWLTRDLGINGFMLWHAGSDFTKEVLE